MPDDPVQGRTGDEGAPGAPPFLFSHLRDAADAAACNRLLAALTAADLRRLVPHLERVHLLQSVACNALHKAEARLARWLLLFQDRLEGTTELPLTQEHLAGMLGLRRGTINEAAQALQRAGLIATRRGRLTVRDRAGLEAASCECYAALREHYEQLLPPAAEEAPAGRPSR